MFRIAMKILDLILLEKVFKEVLEEVLPELNK